MSTTSTSHQLPMATIVAGEGGAPHLVYVADGERVLCPHAGCACDFKNVGSLRNHILHQHNAEPKLVSITQGNPSYKSRPSAVLTTTITKDKMEPRALQELKADTTTDPHIFRELMVGLTPLKQLRELLSCCRITPDNRVSIIDAFVKITGCSHEAATLTWHRISKKLVESTFTAKNMFDRYKFAGSGQRKTPVATIPNLITICSHLPGETGACINTRNAILAARAFAGDSDLADAIHHRGKSMSALEQELLMGDLPSTNKVHREREERKKQEKKLFECNMQELREIVEAMSPEMEFTDTQLKIHWEIANSDRIQFATHIRSVIKKFFETHAAENYPNVMQDRSRFHEDDSNSKKRPRIQQ